MHHVACISAILFRNSVPVEQLPLPYLSLSLFLSHSFNPSLLMDESGEFMAAA